MLSSYGINGLDAQMRLESVGITTNKNMIHGDTLSPKYCSGLRIGFAAATTRGCDVEQARAIARLIDKALSCKEGELESVKAEVRAITMGWKDISKLVF